LRIVEVLKKGNLNFKTYSVDKSTDQKIDKIIDGAIEEGGDEND